jgi:hypothetical protein
MNDYETTQERAQRLMAESRARQAERCARERRQAEEWWRQAVERHAAEQRARQK